MLAQVFELKNVTQKSPRHRPDHQLIGLGHALQPCCPIGRLTDDRRFLRRALPDQVADDHRARRYTDPHRQHHTMRLAHLGIEIGHRSDDIEPRPYRPLRIILVRLWIAEVHQYPVTHIARDEARVALDCLSAVVLKRRNHVP